MKKLVLIAAITMASVPAYSQKGNIGFVYPCGAKRGTSVEVTFGGQNISKAKAVTVSGEGVSGELIPLPPGKKPKKRGKKNIGEEDNLQLAEQVRFRLTIDKNARPGVRDIRLVMPNGMTNRLYFEIGELPDVAESPKEELSGVSGKLPVTFNGQVMRSDVDRFRFHAKKGQQLVIRTKARVFVPYIADAVPGWFQPIIRLYGPDGKEVAYNDDYTFHVDPVLFYKVPLTGDYDIEINDALYRGREDFVYRIDVGELPFVTGISPLGTQVGKKTEIKVRGYNLKGNTVRLRPRKEGRIDIATTSRSGLSSNSVKFDVTSATELDVKGLKPCTDSDNAWDMAFGDCVENVFREPLQQHWYTFSVTGRKQPVHIEVVARQLWAPTDARITLFNSDMEKVRDVDDFENPDDCMTTHFADPQITAPLPSGQYYIRVIESQNHYGEDFAYRLYLDRSKPDFSVYLDPATFQVPENGTGIFNVVLTRKQNFGGPVELGITGLPAGSKVKGTTISAGQKRGIVSITLPKGVDHGTVHPKVVASATKKGQTITRAAVPVESMMQAFYYTHLMPMDEFRMEVGDELPFGIEVVQDWKGALKLNHDGIPVPVKVRIDRRNGYKSPITLMLKSTSSLKAEAVVIPEGESEGTLLLTFRGKRKNRRDQHVGFTVSGVVKGSSKRIAGKGRSAFVASVTAHTPVFEAVIPGISRNP